MTCRVLTVAEKYYHKQTQISVQLDMPEQFLSMDHIWNIKVINKSEGLLSEMNCVKD